MPGELLLWYGIDCGGVKQARVSQRRDGLLNVCPGGILRQDGANNYLKRRAGGPPVLRSKKLKEMPVKGDEPSSGGCLWHTRYCDRFFREVKGRINEQWRDIWGSILERSESEWP